MQNYSYLKLSSVWGVSNCTILLIENYIYNGNDVYFDDLQSLFWNVFAFS